MTTGPYELQTYGVSRAESTQACAIRLARMLNGAAAIHPAFRHWNRQGYTETEWNVPFCTMPPRVEELTAIFEKGRHYTDVSHELMPQLGYSASAWNGDEGPHGVAMRLHVGSYVDFWGFPNQINLDLDSLVSGNADLICAETLKALLLVVVEAWEPSWASVTDLDYVKKLLLAKPMPAFRSGWMTYLSASYARKVVPPPLAITETVAAGGILMLATNDPFAIDNPEHVAVADAIQACLAPLQSDPRLTQSTAGTGGER